MPLQDYNIDPKPSLTSGVFGCGCRDCFEVVYGEAGDMCFLCREADCDGHGECDGAHSYWSEEDDKEASD